MNRGVALPLGPREAELFAEARALPLPDRETWLRRACAEDEALRERVAVLLQADVEAEQRGALRGPSDEDLARWLRKEEGADLAARRIGSCRLGRRIATGGMGVVYEAVQDPPGRTVAVKVLRWALVDDEARARFEHEVRLLGSLTHPAICRIYEAGVHVDEAGERLPFFVMEYVPDARTIVAYAREKELGRRERIELLAQVCDAVHASHQKGIVHRDLKPANVLVDGTGAPKVIDFGIARSLETNDRALTQTGSTVGTLAYMSPEQLLGDRDAVDVRSDVYALGVTSYEVLTGRLPHALEGLDLVVAAHVVLEQPPVPPEKVVPDLAGDVSVILGKALAKEPDQRYASAAELAADLRRFLRSEPILARAPSLAHMARLFVRRHRAATAAAALVVAALVAAVVVSASYAASESAQRKTAVGQRARAEHVLRQGKDFAPWVLVELDRDLSRLPGSTPVRQKLADGVRRYLQALTTTESDDPEILGAAVEAYSALASLEGAFAAGNLGRHANALEAVGRAKALNDRHRLLRPSDTEALWWSMRLRVLQSEVLSAMGRTAEAEAAIAEGLALARSAKGKDGRIAATANDLRRNRARLAVQEGRIDDALREMNESAIEIEAQGGFAGHNPVFLSAALANRSEIVRTLLTAGRAEEAEPHAHKMKELLEALGDESKDGTLLGRQLRAQADLASLDRVRGRTKQAIARLRRVLVALEAWAERDPEDVYPRVAAVAHRHDLAQALEAAGRAEDALEEYTRVAKTGRAVLVRTPAEDQTEWNVLAAEMRRGRILLKSGRPAEAETAYTGALAMAKHREAAGRLEARSATVPLDVELSLAEAEIAAGQGLPPDGALAKATGARERIVRVARAFEATPAGAYRTAAIADAKALLARADDLIANLGPR